MIVVISLIFKLLASLKNIKKPLALKPKLAQFKNFV